MSDRYNMKVGYTKLFYPQYCYDCNLSFIKETESNPCPCCGSGNTINHKGEIYAEVQMRKPDEGGQASEPVLVLLQEDNKLDRCANRRETRVKFKRKG